MHETPETKAPIVIEKKPSILAGIGFTVAWTFIWPMIAFVGAVIFGVIAAALLSEQFTNLEDPNLGLRILIVFGVMFLSILFFITAWLFKKIPIRFFIIGGKTLIVYTWLGIIAGGLALAFIPNAEVQTNTGVNTQSSQTPVTPTLKKDSHLLTVLANVGATQTDGIEVQYVDTFTDLGMFDQAGEYVAYTNPVDGSFQYGTLQIKRGLDNESEKVAVAHEYLHHIWFAKMDAQTIASLTSELIALYGEDRWMQERVASYAESGTLQATELFSYYCTESSSRYLTQYVLDQCNQYILRDNLQLIR